MADEAPQVEQVPKGRKILEKLPLFAKILQVILGIFAVGLIIDPLNSFQYIFNKPRFKLDDAAVVYVTIAGYLLINTLFIISSILGDRVPKRTLILFASVGAFLHVVAGSLLVHNWRKIHGPYNHMYNNEIYPSKQYMDMLISGAVFTFLEAAIFTAEVFLLMKYSRNSEV